jgi:hypothetical protein
MVYGKQEKSRGTLGGAVEGAKGLSAFFLSIFRAGEGAESAFFFPASRTIFITRSFTSRFVAQIARV